MKRKKLEPISVKELVGLIGGREMARRLGVDKSLPCKWAQGQRPKVENARKLVELAEAQGFSMTLEQVLGGGQ